MFVLLRLTGSLVLIAPLLVLGGQRLLPELGERTVLFWVGQLQVSGFMICSVIGVPILPASRAVVLGFTIPLWAPPIGQFLWPEPICWSQLVGQR